MNGNGKTSVVVCAYTQKRWNDALESIDSLTSLDIPPSEIVLVVDHNPDLYNRFCLYFDGNDTVKVIENQDVQGLSGARNSGIIASKGEYIGFLDDDAIADPDWLSRMTTWCEKDENILGVGSKVDPIWVDGKVSWFPAEFNWVVGCSYFGMPVLPTTIRNPFGGGMLVRKKVFDLVGGFRTGTGRVGEVPLGCEETELCIRAQQHCPNTMFIFDPYARIEHKVPSKRLTWAYFLSRCYHEGISKALLARLVGAQDSLSAEKGYTIRVLPKGILKGIADFLFRFDFYGLARAVAIVAGLFTTGFGYLVGLMKISRNSAQEQAVISDITTSVE